MEYMVYNFTDNEKITDIASQFNTTVEEIMRINNVSPPYPILAKDLPTSIKGEGNTNLISVPLVTNGNQSFESYNFNSYKNMGVYYNSPTTLKRSMYNNANYKQSINVDFKNIRPGRQAVNCYIAASTNTGQQGYSTNGDINEFAALYFPCYPDSVSDSNQASYSSQTILGRSEPFQYYTGSGPRTVSVDFTLHSDMFPNNLNYIYQLTNFVEACCYPRYGNNIAATKVIFHCAKNIHIVGIITSVSTKYSGPVLDMQPGPTGDYNGSIMREPKYAVVDLSFSVTEVTGDPPAFSNVASMFNNGGMRSPSSIQ